MNIKLIASLFLLYLILHSFPNSADGQTTWKDTTKPIIVGENIRRSCDITVDKEEFRRGINALAIGEMFAKLYFVQDSITQIMELRNENQLQVISQLRIEYNRILDALQKEKADRPDVFGIISKTALITLVLAVVGCLVIR